MISGMEPTPPPSWPELYAQIGELAARLPALMQQYPDPEACLEAVRRESSVIQESAEYDEAIAHSVFVAINHMLVDAGLVPPEQRQF